MKFRHHHLTGLGAKADAKNGSGARQKNKEKLARKEKVLYLCKKVKVHTVDKVKHCSFQVWAFFLLISIL